jgi:hypothetical protein
MPTKLIKLIVGSPNSTRDHYVDDLVTVDITVVAAQAAGSGTSVPKNADDVTVIIGLVNFPVSVLRRFKRGVLASESFDVLQKTSSYSLRGHVLISLYSLLWPLSSIFLHLLTLALAGHFYNDTAFYNGTPPMWRVARIVSLGSLTSLLLWAITRGPIEAHDTAQRLMLDYEVLVRQGGLQCN